MAIMREEGFYVTTRVMSAPGGARGRGSFGEASPIELPTPRELQLTADRCGPTEPPPHVGGKSVLRIMQGAMHMAMSGQLPPGQMHAGALPSMHLSLRYITCCHPVFISACPQFVFAMYRHSLWDFISLAPYFIVH